MDERPEPEAANHEEWLLDRELDVAAEVYAGELGLRRPLFELTDDELLERYRRAAGFHLHFEEHW